MSFIFSKRKTKWNSQSSGNHGGSGFGRGGRRERARRNIFFALRSIIYKIMILAVLGGAFYFLFFSSFFSVKNIEISGNNLIAGEEIKKAVMEVADRKIFKIFSNNLLLIRKADIEDSIKSKFSNITTLEVDRKFPGSLKIAVKEKPIDILWCNAIKVEKIIAKKSAEEKEPVLTEAYQCYFSDEENNVYRKAEGEMGKNSIKVFRDEGINLGARIGDDELKKFIREINANFASKIGLAVNYLYLPSISLREMRIFTAKGWKAYFDTTRSANEQIDVLNNVLKTAMTEKEKEELDYVDLRVVDRVYFKVK